MTLGEKLRTLRKGKYTQEKLAEQIGIHVNTLYGWEHDKTIPPVEKLKTLADKLGTTIAYLLEEHNTDLPVINTPPIDEIVHDDNIVNDATEKRLIIKNRDLYINLPETIAGFNILNRFFDTQPREKSRKLALVGQ